MAWVVALVLITGLVFGVLRRNELRQVKHRAAESQAAELATYENKELGFKFNYPKAWGPIYFERQYGCGRTGSVYSLKFEGMKNFNGGGVFGGLYSHDYATDCKERNTGFDTYPACEDIPGTYYKDFYQSGDACVRGYAERLSTHDRTGVIVQKAFKNTNYGGIEIEAAGFTLGDFSQDGLKNYYSDAFMLSFIQDLTKLAKSITQN